MLRSALTPTIMRSPGLRDLRSDKRRRGHGRLTVLGDGPVQSSWRCGQASLEQSLVGTSTHWQLVPREPRVPRQDRTQAPLSPVRNPHFLMATDTQWPLADRVPNSNARSSSCVVTGRI